ncbi:Spondin_N [Alteromonadaceae bacterium Bs31]|nr:Spondin_N [Alteromonadaceae bacterium Bs31]
MKIKHILITSLLGLCASGAAAETISVKITNLTQGLYFTPLLVAAHSESAHLFEVGSEASEQLQAMAEGGDISGLATLASSVGAVSSENPAGGLLTPGASTMVMDWDTGSNDRLSIVAMLLPTNDGFVGLDSWTIPSEAGTYTIMLNGYDAGTEANNELVVEGSGAPGMLGIPANPGGNSGSDGTGVTTEEGNSTVHIHRGTLGDAMESGGTSDLNSSIHRWLNPVAKVVITVQ